MKVYKQIMDGLVKVEKWILILSSVVVTTITFANVLSRYVFHASFSWSEELVINLFVLMIMMGCGLCARDGSLISLSLFFDRMKVKGKKVFVLIITVANSAFWLVLIKTGFAKVLTEMANGSQTFVLRWPAWVFTIFLPIGAIFLLIHTIEFCIDVMAGEADCVKQINEGGND